jgi:peptidoglycan/LPS O-acetylase OafA/YrhL
MNTNLEHRFPALTGIRFPLALWVIAYHISGRGQMWGSVFSEPWIAAIMSKAYVALGTFFALSGFLLTRAYLDGPWNRSKLSRYLVARAARIAPLYYLSLLVVAPIIWGQLQNPQLGSVVDRAGVLFGYLFLLQGWVRFPVDWNTPAWSLSCEVFYYACLPAAAWLLPRKPASSVFPLLAIAFGLPILVHSLQPPAGLKIFTYIGDFFVGMACAAIYSGLGSRAKALSGRGQWLYIPAGLLAGALLLWSQLLPWLASDELMRLANAGLVLGFAFGGGRVDRLLSSRIAMTGGAASFAAYILHIPVLWWFRRTPGVAALPEVLAGWVYVFVVAIVAYAAYRWVEIPANALIRAKLAPDVVPVRSRAREVGTEGVDVEAFPMRQPRRLGGSLHPARPLPHDLR